VTVYVLGAGASVHAGYPLASELSCEIEKWACSVYKRVSWADPDICGCFATLRAAFHDEVGNFEVILTRLQQYRRDPVAGEVLHEHPGISGVLTAGLVGLFRERQQSDPRPDLYEWLAARVRPGDTIITFNYDCAIERALKHAELWEVGDGYGFLIGEGLTPASAVKVLKLHGSVNWFGLMFGGSRGAGQDESAFGPRPVVLFDADMRYLGYSSLRDPRWRNLAPALPAMIFGFDKQFYWDTNRGREWQDFWDDIWEQARRELSRATEVIVVGYGFAVQDGRARELILGGANRDARITVCCHEQTEFIKREFHSQGYGRVVSPPVPTFEGWLALPPVECD
jgi:hypothetical protein